MTEKRIKWKLRSLYFLNITFFSAMTALKALVFLGLLLTFVVNYAIFESPMPVVIIPPKLFYALLILALVSGFRILSYTRNRNWTIVNEDLNDMIRQQEQKIQAGEIAAPVERQNFIDRLAPRLRYSVSAYVFLFLRDRYRQLAGILKFSLPWDSVPVVLFMVIPILLGILSFAPQIGCRSFGDPSAQSSQPIPGNPFSKQEETKRISGMEAEKRLEQALNEHCQHVLKSRTSGLNARTRFSADAKDLDQPGNFSILLDLKRGRYGRIRNVTYSMYLDADLTTEEKLQEFETQMAFFDNVIRDLGIPVAKKQQPQEISFPEDFRKAFLDSQETRDVSVSVSQNPQLRFYTNVPDEESEIAEGITGVMTLEVIYGP